MRITLEQAEVLARHNPTLRALLDQERAQPAAVASERSPRPRHVTGEPNKTEAAYGRHLDDLAAAGRIEGHAFEAIKVRLAGRCWLTIDYAVRVRGGLMLVDVKGGPLEDDASVKIKVCATTYPYWPLYLVYRERGAWVYRPVTTTGIGAWCPEPF